MSHQQHTAPAPRYCTCTPGTALGLSAHAHQETPLPNPSLTSHSGWPPCNGQHQASTIEPLAETPPTTLRLSVRKSLGNRSDMNQLAVCVSCTFFVQPPTPPSVVGQIGASYFTHTRARARSLRGHTCPPCAPTCGEHPRTPVWRTPSLRHRRRPTTAHP